jgi:predicted enzyme related to lactoylglutathione lyase
MHGTVCWHEVHTPDAKGAAKFYKGLFGWDVTKADDLGIPYHYLGRDGQNFGGMMAAAGTGAPPHWLVYFAVTDIDAAAKKVAKLGGKVLVPVTALPFGRFAVAADPSGAAFGLFQTNG